jgi:hypothetical protein
VIQLATPYGRSKDFAGQDSVVDQIKRFSVVTENNRLKQKMKLERDCRSEWKDISAGVLQGTKQGSWLLLLMIDDIEVTDTELWKYVDDTTTAETVLKDEISNIQKAVSELAIKSHQNKLQLDERKCLK